MHDGEHADCSLLAVAVILSLADFTPNRTDGAGVMALGGANANVGTSSHMNGVLETVEINSTK